MGIAALFRCPPNRQPSKGISKLCSVKSSHAYEGPYAAAASSPPHIGALEPRESDSAGGRVRCISAATARMLYIARSSETVRAGGG